MGAITVTFDKRPIKLGNLIIVCGKMQIGGPSLDFPAATLVPYINEIINVKFSIPVSSLPPCYVRIDGQDGGVSHVGVLELPFSLFDCIYAITDINPATGQSTGKKNRFSIRANSYNALVGDPSTEYGPVSVGTKIGACIGATFEPKEINFMVIGKK